MTLFFQRSAMRPRQLAAGFLLVLSVLVPAHASRLMAFRGILHIERNQQLAQVAVGTVFREGDTLVVEPDGEALVRFRDGANMVLRSDSRVSFDQLVQAGPQKSRKKTLKILKGGMRYVSGRAARQSKVAFVTQTATIGIRGTDIEIAVSEDTSSANPSGTYLKVNTGQASLVGRDGTQVDVDPGEVAFGSEPELTPRGIGGVRRPAARRIEGASNAIFKAGALDSLLR